MVSLFGSAGIIACCSSCTSAFVLPSTAALANTAPTRAVAAAPAISSSNRRRPMTLSAEKKDGEEDQEPMDLDLEQMFEVSARLDCTLHRVQ